MHEGRRAPSVHHFSCERGPNLIRDGAARVGVGLPARPCCTVKPRQQGLDFPETVPIVLASASLQGLVLPSSHANKDRNFPCRRCSCWRQPLCKVLIHRQAAPTGTGISRDGAARVGVGLPGRPCCTVKPRQQGLNFPETVPLVLAWAFPQGLVSPSSHANKALIFPRRSCCRRINPSAFSGNSRTLWCLPSR